MVSVCLPSDALLQHLPSYLGFSYLGRGVSLYCCSSKAQPLLLTLDEGYLLTAAVPDLQHGIAPLGSPVPAQPSLLGLLLLASSVCGSSQLPTPALVSGWLLRLTTTGLGCWVASPGRRPDLGQGVFPPGRHWPRPLGSSSRPPSRSRMLGGSSLPFLRRCSLAL